MALNSLFLMAVLAVVYVSAEAEASKPVYQEAKCIPELIQKIQGLGNKYKNTDPVFQNKGTTWIVAKVTGTPKYKDVKCLKYRTEGGGKLTAIKDGVESVVTEREEGNRIYINGDNNLHYKIWSDAAKGIYVGYACSEHGPVDQAPTMGVTVTSSTSKAVEEEATRLVEQQLGYKLSKVFQC